MNGLLRSKNGCWTCRLRKKKCDERKPSPCSLCESLAITCYGYGAKPEWMDNGIKEKEMANSIKQIVKHTSRRKIRPAVSDTGQDNGENRESSIFNLAQKPSTLFSKGSHKKVSSEYSPAQSTHTTSVDTSMALTPGNGSILLSTLPPAGGEAALLMHFLDNVFPLQYPIYKPEVAEGGRGWLLSLLLKTKPLYHASIGLSAYHRGVVLRAKSYGGCTKPSIAEQEGHLAICLNEFQNAIRSAQNNTDCGSAVPESSLGIMACVVQLIFFELFGVRKSSWQIHLRAATEFLGQRYRKHATELGFMVNGESTSNMLRTACELTNGETSIIFLFLSGVIMWLDIVSCLSTGKSPQLLDLHLIVLGVKPQIKLEKIMGCKNWVMTEIGRIAELHESKRNGLQNGTFDAHSFKTQADDIRQTIRRGQNEQFLSELRITSPNSTSHVNSPIGPHEIITRMFTRGAHIYLELVVGGFKWVEENSDFCVIVDEVTMILPNLPRGDLLRAMVCPLYIFGCVAKAEDRDIFRNIFSSLPLNDPFMHHRATILPLLEKVWFLRDNHSNDVSWECVLQLSEDKIILI
ncbi:d1d0f868-bc7f-4041-9282-0bd0376a3ad6 [Sclerotinia trifoliorum]|uniref:D1d0f868-bc7f-4041-9282-0bd0376a3ad6 n=1 Tax=Sclerotinia trifoliorum TaxID=28548 RepID=A0A8H2VP03_9HELO|nr:d1d0f868-bc7f-4041-9282-0bd0376a3ad6 [Sclerotinia trifoliorum]